VSWPPDSNTWIAFARNGKPAIRNPDWPAYTRAERANDDPRHHRRVTHDADRDARLLWTRGVRN